VTLRLVLNTPARHTTWDDVTLVRVLALDGHRGIQPGHEPAVLALQQGVVHVVRLHDGKPRERFLATEGGVAWIDPSQVVLTSRWIAEASHDLDVILARLRGRAEERSLRENEARALLSRHETATRRALIDLQREVSW